MCAATGGRGRLRKTNRATVKPVLSFYFLVLSSQLVLTLTLSRPTGEGTAIGIFSFVVRPSGQSRRLICRAAGNDSPSPIGWERAGVRVKRFSKHAKTLCSLRSFAVNFSRSETAHHPHLQADRRTGVGAAGRVAGAQLEAARSAVCALRVRVRQDEQIGRASCRERV